MKQQLLPIAFSYLTDNKTIARAASSYKKKTPSSFLKGSKSTKGDDTC